MRSIRIFGILALGATLLSAVGANAQSTRKPTPTQGLFCLKCQPKTATVFQEPKEKDPLPLSMTESQTVSLFSPWLTNATRLPPVRQTAEPAELLTYLYGLGPAVVLQSSPEFVSPGSFFVTWEAITDLYASSDGQQSGIYFAYYVKEDTNNNGVFCPTDPSDNCGYLVQHTSGPYFGITAMAYTAPDTNSPSLILNSSVPLSQTFAVKSTPGLHNIVEIHVWGAHFIKDVQRLLYIGSNRMMITRGPNS